MSYRSILVHLDQSALCDARTRFAIGLANSHESHLFGLAPTSVAHFPLTVDSAAPLVEYADIAWKAVRSQAEVTVRTFREACRRVPGASFDAAIDESATASALVRHADEADLLVLSQADPDAADYPGARAIVEEVVLHSPRPTLILPYAGRFDGPFRIALVAWDGSRESARAIADALPLLRRCEQVHMVSWSEGEGEGEGDRDRERDGVTVRSRLEAVRQWLARHDVTATTHCEPTADIGIADAMLSRAADLNADFIVMGAYGHRRWTERILGGATRGLLETMTVPVLMSR